MPNGGKPITVDILTAAERESNKRYPETVFASENETRADDFVEGAVWAQSRLTPTRDELAMTVATFFGPKDTPDDVADAILERMQEVAEGVGGKSENGYGGAMHKETELALRNYDYLIRSKGLSEVSLHWDQDTLVWGDGGSLISESLLTPGFTPATTDFEL